MESEDYERILKSLEQYEEAYRQRKKMYEEWYENRRYPNEKIPFDESECIDVINKCHSEIVAIRKIIDKLRKGEIQ